MEHDGRGSSDSIIVIKMDCWSPMGGDTGAIIKHIKPFYC